LTWILWKEETKILIASEEVNIRRICHCNDSSFYTTKGVIQAMKKKDPVLSISGKINPSNKKIYLDIIPSA